MQQALPLGGGVWRGPSLRGADPGQRVNLGGWLSCARLPDDSWSWREPLAASARPAGATAEAQRAWEMLEAARTAERAPFPQEPRLLGILNLTADSFSDGGALLETDGTVRRPALRAAAVRLREQGAAALDLGAESTRPGAQAVEPERQLQTLLPAVEALRELGLPLSVDTRSARVASACLDAGAAMINDVSGLRDDPDMAPLAAARGCPVFLMHLRGSPADMRERAVYRHLLGEIADELMERVQAGLRAGMNKEQIVLDPGIGFAKNAAQSRELVARCGAFRALGFPLLLGPSRKSFLAGFEAEDTPTLPPAARDAASLGAAVLCAAQGAAWLRMHDGSGFAAVRAAAACARAARGEAR